MVDYVKSLEIGLAQAKAAARNRQEIAAVFAELNAQLAAATNDKVSVQREQFSEPQDILSTFSLKPPPKYQAISARHRLHKSARVFELAKWGEAPAGYPCKISQRDQDVYCENREALEKGLDALLRSPFVGEAFLTLMSFEPSPST